MTGPASLEERRIYARGYAAGRKHDAGRAEAAVFLFEALVSGLATQGLSADDILDAQLIGAKARSRPDERQRPDS